MITHRLAGSIRALAPLLNSEKGSVGMVFAVAGPVLVAAVAAALSYSAVAGARSNLQSVADSAALLGAKVARTSSASTAEQDAKAAVQSFVGAKARTSVESLETIVSANLEQVTVSVQSSKGAILKDFNGTGKVPMSVTATAISNQIPMPICLLATNTAGSQGLVFSGSGGFVGTDCLVWSNNPSTTSIKVQGSGSLVADTVCASGQVSRTGSGTITPAATTGCPAFPDPLATWTPAALSTTCTNPPISGGMMNPGVYCTAVNVSAGNVTLAPGVYVLKDKNMVITSTANVTGTGVQFLLMGSAQLTVSASADIDISGITDAAGNKVLIAEYGTMVAGQSTSFSSNSKLFLDGIVHLPSQHLTVSGNSTVAMSGPASSIIASTITVSGSGLIRYPGSTKAKAPQKLRNDFTLRLVK